MMMDAMMMTRIGGVVVAATYRLSRLVTRPETTTPRPRQDHDGGDGRRAREEGAKPRALTLTVRGPEREDAVDVLYILSDTERAFFFQGNAFSNLTRCFLGIEPRGGSDASATATDALGPDGARARAGSGGRRCGISCLR